MLEKASVTTLRTKAKAHVDHAFVQDWAVKYYIKEEVALKQIGCDRDGNIQILADNRLYKPYGGHFLLAGELVPDLSYRPMKDKKVASMQVLEQELVYLDEEAIFSNAWAGSLFQKHEVQNAQLFAAAAPNKVLIANANSLLYKEGDKAIWEKNWNTEQIIKLRYKAKQQQYWILSKGKLWSFDPVKKDLRLVFEADNLTSFDISQNGEQAYVATNNGYWRVDIKGRRAIGNIQQKMPWTDLTIIENIDGKWWFGSRKGAFMLNINGKYNYYHGERWLPSNEVVDIKKGADRSILILTQKGLGHLHFEKMTLAEKADYFEQQTRKRHIRHGFNADLVGMKNGHLGTGYLRDSDNDGLWTSMYLGGQVFRYVSTKSPEAMENIKASMQAMTRLYDVNPVAGFPSRSFARSGYIPQLADPHRWQHAPDKEWDWKATTSSDEAIGHVFVFGVIAELIEEPALKNQAIRYLDTLMQHIVENDFYLVDFDGKPTTWGKWNPDYVNARMEMVGDRKLNSSNIIAMLQTAYHFTKKEIYKEKAYELMYEHGYLKNLMRPMEDIGVAPTSASDYDKMLSENWNHSDDEMYYLGYWGLYRYAFTDSLKTMYKEAIIDHFEFEKPEKEGLWNIMTYLVGDGDYDLEEAIWFLQEYPMDLITWDVENSHRKDIELLPQNFRRQTTKEVLPPDERPLSRHNGNCFNLDRKRGNGGAERSAGDIWLLPYWMGKYLGVIEDGRR
jgi:hypothetical protein